MRQHLIVLFAAISVLGLGYGGYFVMFQEAEYRTLTVTSVTGAVTRSDERGVAVPAGPGDSVEASNVIRVGATGRALLTAGEGTQLLLEEETSVRVVAANRRGVQVELDEGRVKARVQPGSRMLGVRSGGQLARSDGGGFAVARDADGFVRVAVEDGSVEIDGPDGTRTLESGERLDAAPDGTSVLSSAVLEEILLEVRWADAKPGDAPVPVEGRTTPYARVAIEGPTGTSTTHADRDGRFAGEVAVPSGSHTITVDVSDGLGLEASDTRVVSRPAAVPVASTEVVFGE